MEGNLTADDKPFWPTTVEAITAPPPQPRPRKPLLGSDGRPLGPPPCDRCGRRAEKLYFTLGKLLCLHCDFAERAAARMALETK